MSAADCDRSTSSASCTAPSPSSSVDRLLLLRESSIDGRSIRSNGSSASTSGKRVSWKLANMAAIATPESDDDFDVIDPDVRVTTTNRPPSPTMDDQRAAFYHVTQEGGWVMSTGLRSGRRRDDVEASRPNGIDGIRGNGIVRGGEGGGAAAEDAEARRPERAWAVVARPSSSTVCPSSPDRLRRSNDADDDRPGGGGRAGPSRVCSVIETDDRQVTYVVTTWCSIARPENGPQLIRAGDDRHQTSRTPDRDDEPEIVASRSTTTCRQLDVDRRPHSADDDTARRPTGESLPLTEEEEEEEATLRRPQPTSGRTQTNGEPENDDVDDRYRVGFEDEENARPRSTSMMTTSTTATTPTAMMMMMESEAAHQQQQQLTVTPPPKHFVVVAVDFGTALSGYAFGFVRDPGRAVHMMRRWEGGDPGVVNQKTPTALLLDPEGRFHSFGCAARDFYHDLDDDEAASWMYFDKFKMALHHDANLNRNTTLTAANGRRHSALAVFAHALRYFRDHAVRELTDQSSTAIVDDDIRWVITVPAIWRPAAKQFMRQAAIEAGMTSPENPERLLIALEPEAASIYVRKLRLYQLVPDSQGSVQSMTPRSTRSSCCLPDEDFSTSNRLSRSLSRDLAGSIPQLSDRTVEQDVELAGSRCMVVDCGGGTVDITVHEIDPTNSGRLREVYKATGGPYGSVGVDLDFEKLLVNIFGSDFITAYKRKRPSGWVDLMVAFESRKRSANPTKDHPLNICLPFSFIDYHKKHRGCQVETAINKYGDKSVRWSSQGMLRLTLDAMTRLFASTVDQIKQSIGDVIDAVPDVGCMFLVGGFSESPLLQQELRSAFGDELKIFVPQDVALTVLKGAVYFGLDPAAVTRRRSMLTYGVEVLNRFDAQQHPQSKLIRRGGLDWCTGIFDTFVRADQDVDLGQTIVRRYGPPSADQLHTVINIYSCERPDVRFVTDSDVTRCGQLRLDLVADNDLPSSSAAPSSPAAAAAPAAAADGNLEDATSGGTAAGDRSSVEQLPTTTRKRRREIQTRMTFGDTEIKISAVDVTTGRCVLASVDFLGHI